MLNQFARTELLLGREAMERRARIAFSNVSAYLDGAPRNVCR